MGKKQSILNEISGVDRIVTHYQAIISIEKRNIIGVEALSRGYQHNKIISPTEMLNYAYQNNSIIELDRIFRRNAVEQFCRNENRNDLLLFLNIDISNLEKVVGSNNIINLIRSFNLKPQSICLEINEAKISKTQSLQKFVSKCKQLGFIIALDDIGKGFSNINRIPMLVPDIIKIDLNLIKNIDQDYYKQEVLKSITQLSKKVGALVIAEGVETINELSFVLKTGVDLIQGYFFTKPTENIETQFIHVKPRIEKAVKIYKNCLKEIISQDYTIKKKYLNIVIQYIKEVEYINNNDYNKKLRQLIKKYPAVKTIFILDKEGTQISDTIINQDINYRKNKIFHPAHQKTDHSLKKYVYFLHKSEANHYISSPYISLATGNLCITISKYFKKKSLILCVDFNI